MRCDHCKKEKTLKTYAEVKEGKRYRLSLCEDCLALYLSRAPEFSGTESSTAAKPGRRSSDSSGGTPTATKKKRYPGRPEKCHKCNTTWHQAESGLLGCPACFYLFRRELQEAREALMPQQGYSPYEGEFPEGEDIHKQLRLTVRQKREQLRVVLAREEYEEAARLRAEIAKLENDLSTTPSGTEP